MELEVLVLEEQNRNCKGEFTISNTHILLSHTIFRGINKKMSSA